MIVSTTNIASTASISTVPASTLQDIYVVTDGDYSSLFVEPLASEIQIKFQFAQPTDIGYLAIGGSNISTKDSIEIIAADTTAFAFWQTASGEQLVSNEPFDLTVGLENMIDDTNLGEVDSNSMMYQVDLVQVQQLIITVKGTGDISIAEIAMGDYYVIPKGEQAGYSRGWSVPNIKVRGSTGLNESPISLSYEARSLSLSLSVPNNLMVDFDGWYKFINFAASNTFYALEDDNKFHSYACFNAVPDMTRAHSSTRSLGVSSIKFNAHAKSTEATF
jgi:hypothetical protein